MRINFLPLLLTAFTLYMYLFAGCKPDAPAPAHNYPDEVAAILTRSCAIAGCHTGSNAPQNLDMSSWERLMQGSDFGAIVIPYSVQWSHLFQHLNTYEDLGIRATPVMPPPPAAPLPREEVLTIQKWLAEGAPSKSGQIPWAERENTGAGKLFALCAGSDLVSVADLDQNLVMRQIAVGQLPQDLEAPHFIRLSPDGQYFYLSLINGALVEKYRTDNYAFEGRVEVGPDPAIIILSPDGERLLVTHWNDTPGQPKLSMVRTSDMQLVDQIVAGGDVLSYPHGLVATKDFRMLYVVAHQGNYYAKIEMDENGFTGIEQVPLDPANSPIPQASTAYKPYYCLLSPDESQLFVSCNITDEVRVFSTASDALIARIPTGDFPRLMDYDPVDNRLYVACANEENQAEQGALKGCVSVLDMENMTFVQNIYRLGHRPHGVRVDVRRRRLYVSSENVGGVDPPHHPTNDAGPPGKYNVVDLHTLEVLKEMETEIAVFPNALEVSE